MKNHNILPIILRISVALMLACGILLLTSFKKTDTAESGVLDNDDPVPNLNSYLIDNPLVKRSNNFGGLEKDGLLNVFSDLSSYTLITKTASKNTNYNSSSPGLYLIKLDKTGNFQSVLFLGNKNYLDSIALGDQTFILLENKLLTISKTLQITEEECAFTNVFKKDNILFFYSKIGSLYFNNTNYKLNFTDFEVLNVDYINHIIFIYKQNCLYLVDYINNKTLFSFYDISCPAVFTEDESYVFSAIIDGGLVVTKLNTLGEVLYSYFYEAKVQNYSLTKYFYGYFIITQTSKGLSDFMLCKHLDLISTNSIDFPNANTLLTTQLISDVLYITYLTNSENLKFISYSGQTSLSAVLNGIGADYKVLQADNCLFIETSSTNNDFKKNNGSSDVFFFSFNYL